MSLHSFSIRHLYLTILFLWLVVVHGRGQTFRVDHIGVAQGLTQGSVYHMLKDSRGFMWFGTQDGLNQYDGHNFRIFHPAAVGGAAHRGNRIKAAGSIRGINIFGIVETPDGAIWVGTEEGLNRYDREHDQFSCFKFESRLTKRLLSSRTLPFYADAHELLYLSDAEGLVSLNWRTLKKHVLNPTLKPAQEYDLQSSTVRTPAGDVWLHAAKGVIRYNIRERSIHTYFGNGPTNETGAPTPIFSFYIDKDQIAWLGTATTLIRFDHRSCDYKSYQLGTIRTLSPVYSLAEDQSGLLWMGTQAHGLLYFDKHTRTFGAVTHFTNDNHRLKNYEISKVYVDDQNIVWANVDPDGLARVIPNSFLFSGMLKSRQPSDPNLEVTRLLSNYSVRAFLEETPRRVWVATEKGINVFDPVTRQIVDRHLVDVERSTLPMHNFIKSLYRDWSGTIWVGSIGGAMRYRPATRAFETVPFPQTINSLVAANYVRNLVSIDTTTLAAATEDGIFTLNTDTHTWTVEAALPHQNLFCFQFDRGTRQLWVGTYLHGFSVFQLPPKGQKGHWKLLRTGLSGSTVLHFQDDPSRNTVWISTDRGLVAYNRQTKQIRLFGEHQGLANSFVYGSLRDEKGAVWISTNRGLSRLDAAQNQFTNFKLTDGLQGYEYNGNALLKASDGQLYFGGVDGFNHFRPETYHTNRLNPRVHVYNFNVNEEPFRPDNRYVGELNAIDLNYRQNTLSLEFAALDFLSTGNNTYQYQLRGYDENWVQAGERNYVRYPNLPPGDYTFQVKAANKDNHWSNYVRQLHISISPPFWRTIPFILVFISLLAGGAFWYVHRREALIRTKEAERLKLAYDIQEQTKKSIARDLHDEIGTRLATLKLYTTQLVQHTPESSDIRSIKANMFGLINDTISDVRTLLRKLDPRTLEQHGYIAAVEELFGRINATEAIQMSLTVIQAPNRLSKNTGLMLYRITQELVNNSLKHANAAQINLTVNAHDQSLNLDYTDNGQGFDYEHSVQGLGIGNIESRVAMLDGKITWQSGPGRGTRAMIDIPLKALDNGRQSQSSISAPTVSG
jgi:signal transduction histidine kinase/ligand-binding sensor domain-containing protein